MSPTTSHVLEKALTPAELEKCRETFTKLKTYKDGVADSSEYMDFCNSIGIPTTPEQAEIYRGFYRLARGDNLVGIDKVMAYLAALHDAKLLILEIAKSFDKNGDGIISKAEFEVGMKTLAAFDPANYGEKGKIEYDQLLPEADTNKDGKIQIEELAAWLIKK